MSSFPSIGSRPNLRPILLPTEAAREGSRGIARQGGAREHDQRPGVITAGRAEAAHLFPLHGARVLQMFCVERARAGPEEVQSLSTARAHQRMTQLIIFAHRTTLGLCAKNATTFVGRRGRLLERD